MKKATLQLFLLVTITVTSQNYFYENTIINYDASSLLFSKENIKGTARYIAMGGAFGALGGDLSATGVNPAGLAIFTNSEASLTFDKNNTVTNSNFYGTTNNSSNTSFNLGQAGAALVFQNDYGRWNKFAVGINFTVINDFDNSYLTTGKSPLTNFNEDPFLNFDNNNTNDVFYENVDSQKFSNHTRGSNDRLTFSIAGQYNDNTYFGVSLNSHSLDYFQEIIFIENSNDGTNTLEAKLNQQLLIFGDGISLNFGVISKSIKNVRLGLAYQTPTWYYLNEEFRDNLNINPSNTTRSYSERQEGFFEYRMKTPSKMTGSIAYIFGKQGLLSVDYTYRDFNNIKLKPNAEFNAENENLNNLNGTSEIKIGGEYRYKSISLRAGYHTEENPIKTITTNNNGYSLGLGFKLSNTTKLDFSYNKTTSEDNYRFLNFVNPAENRITNDQVTATITIGL
ncbi:MAG: outer membrane protein transport protein [Flavobacteriaceae bacterium]|nr:outer membrane protein transport protein [Flavobacteriaceae bacterium]